MFKSSMLDLLKKYYASTNPTLGAPDTYDVYKHKNGIDTAKSYSDAVSSLFARSKKNMSSYGNNNRIINNKGLQNSGYADYIDAKAENAFTYGKAELEDEYAKSEEKNLSSYAAYLDQFEKQSRSTKNSVHSHLVNNKILDLNTALAYGINSGLSFDDARAVSESAYQTVKGKIANEILKQTVSLGLDRTGAKTLAVKMGLSSSDAEEIAKEVEELLGYYRSISKDYLDFLEQRSG